MNVLISAYACAPGVGSEAGAGWRWVTEAATEHRVWVLTRTTNRAAIEDSLDRHAHGGAEFIYLDLPAPVRRLKHLPGGLYPYYLAWQVLAYFKARSLARTVHLDVVHHLTFAIDWLPAGVAWAAPHARFVWGPVGGTGSAPLRLWKWLGMRGVLADMARRTLVRAARRVWGDAVARRASIVIAQNDLVAARFNRLARVIVEPHVALDALPVANRTAGRKSAVFAGRLLPWKGVALAIAALAESPAQDWCLDIFGDGPDGPRLRRLAVQYGVAGRVRFHGAQSRDVVLAHLSRSNALIFPSMHDAAGWIVAESTAMGVPVICLDIAGPAVLVGRNGGVRVPISQRNLPTTLASAMSEVQRIEPTERWHRDRITALVNAWYSAPTAEGSTSDAA